MLDIKVNLLKNRLYVTYSPYPADTFENNIAGITKAAEKLSPGFTCIARIINVGEIDRKIMQFVRQARKHLIQYGMARVVRVGELSLKQAFAANLIPSELETDYTHYPCPIFTADSMEKAELMLDRYERNRSDEYELPLTGSQ